jgi:hypothetical protein
MAKTLTDYMVRLALDATLLGEFLSNPEASLSRSGLDPKHQFVLNSGSTALIYAALVAEHNEQRISDGPQTVRNSGVTKSHAP